MIIDKQKINERWDTLPEVIREAVFSDAVNDFIGATCEEEHLSEEKIGGVARVTGYALYGFIHPEDIGKELVATLQIPQQVGDSISKKINARILAPLKPVLDKIYSPISRTTTETQAVSMENSGPKIISDEPASATQVPTAPKPAAPPKPAPAPTPAPAPKPQPKPFTESGWSRLTAGAFPPAPKESKSVPPKAATPISQVSKSDFKITITPADKFDRFGTTPPPPAPKPATAQEPAPVIIHEDAVNKTSAAKPDFHISIPTSRAEMNKNASAPTVRPALLELGKKTDIAAPKNPTPTPPPNTPNVVHYDEAKDGPRHITEITGVTDSQTPPAEVATTPTPPAPPQPQKSDLKPAPLNPTPHTTPPPPPAPKPGAPSTPKPPAPPKPDSGSTKVIQKDYT